MNKNEGNGKLVLDVIWGLAVMGIASLCLRDTVHTFLGMTYITFWDALVVIFLIYYIKLILKDAE